VYDYQAGKLELWLHFENDVPFSYCTILCQINAVFSGDVEHYNSNRLTAGCLSVPVLVWCSMHRHCYFYYVMHCSLLCCITINLTVNLEVKSFQSHLVTRASVLPGLIHVILIPQAQVLCLIYTHKPKGLCLYIKQSTSACGISAMHHITHAG